MGEEVALAGQDLSFDRTTPKSKILQIVKAIRYIVSRARGVVTRLHLAVVGGQKLRVDGNLRLSAVPGARLTLGNSVRFYPGVSVVLDSPTAKVSIGAGTYLNRRTQIFSEDKVCIGANCAISWDVTIMDTDYHLIGKSERTQATLIGNQVLIGSGATILKGVRIGDGAVIGAGSVVTRDVPENSIAAGNPARVVREHISWK